MTFWDGFKESWKSQTPWERTKSSMKAAALGVGIAGVCALGSAVAGGAGVALALLGTGAVAYGVDAVKTYKKAKSIKKDMSIPKDKKKKMIRKLVDRVSIGATLGMYKTDDLFKAQERVSDKVEKGKLKSFAVTENSEVRRGTDGAKISYIEKNGGRE